MNKLFINILIANAITLSTALYAQEDTTKVSLKETTESAIAKSAITDSTLKTAMDTLTATTPIKIKLNERYAIRENVVNAFAKPDSKSEVLWQLEKNAPVIALQQEGEWIEIKDFQGDNSWIKASQAELKKTVITRKRANIRSGAGPENPVLYYSRIGVPFDVVQQEGKWLKIKHDSGKEGWIYKPLVW